MVAPSTIALAFRRNRFTGMDSGAVVAMGRAARLHVPDGRDCRQISGFNGKRENVLLLLRKAT
jgi:hypothetical protein